MKVRQSRFAWMQRASAWMTAATLSAVASLGCSPSPGPQPPPLPVPTSTGLQPMPPGPQVSLVDPVKNGMSVAGATALCDDHLALAREIVATIKRVDAKSPDELTWGSTMGRFDDVYLAIFDASEFPYLMGVVHPDRAVREAAQSCESKTDELMTGLFLDDQLAAVLKAYAAKKEKLSPEQQRFLDETLRDFRRNGIDLPENKRERLRAINQELTQLGQKFIAEIGATKGKIQVGKKQLEGLPDAYVKSHKPDADGMIEITTDYPDFYPFVKYSRDRDAARNLYVAFTNRGGDVNVSRLERILALREEKAQMLGYATWGDYAIEPRMAKDAKTVEAFLDRVAKAIEPAVKTELAEFRQAFDSMGFKGKPMLPSDRYFLTEHLKDTKYKLDTKELARYFDLSRVTKGLLDLTSEMYGLSYERLSEEAWHPNVELYLVKDKASGKEIGRFYLDLVPRENKYKHAAMFTVRTRKLLRDGTLQTPIAALVCNFPKAGEPMLHDQVVTYFHEFGHVLHHILTETDLAAFSGTNTVRDFVETPSQMFEEWAWSKSVLDRFARHEETKKKIPQDFFDKMVSARRAGLALATERQLYLARLDLSYHTSKSGFDTTERLKEIHGRHFSFEYVDDTHFQSSFGHLIGYDAGYYGYQWALSLAYDVLSRFKKDGLSNRDTARAWRELVLRRGGSRDPKQMVTAFLGREPSETAYGDFLRGR